MYETDTTAETYYWNAFGGQLDGSGTTVNYYRFGGAWGYMTDPSGLQQLGARFYWPELGRFISQDPIGDGVNWYAYVGSNPVVWVDPEGLWGKHYHFVWTYRAARRAGFERRAARAMAQAAHDIDNWQTLGDSPHFPRSGSSWQGFADAAGRSAQFFSRAGNDREAWKTLGIALHAIQDQYAHEDGRLMHLLKNKLTPGWEEPSSRPCEAGAAQADSAAFLQNWLSGD